MEQIFTSLDLIQFFYKETSSSENAAIKEALAYDREFASEYATLRNGYEQMPKVKFNPSRDAIRNILSYSGQTAMHV